MWHESFVIYTNLSFVVLQGVVPLSFQFDQVVLVLGGEDCINDKQNISNDIKWCLYWISHHWFEWKDINPGRNILRFHRQTTKSEICINVFYLFSSLVPDFVDSVRLIGIESMVDVFYMVNESVFFDFFDKFVMLYEDDVLDEARQPLWEVYDKVLCSPVFIVFMISSNFLSEGYIQSTNK